MHKRSNSHLPQPSATETYGRAAAVVEITPEVLQPPATERPSGGALSRKQPAAGVSSSSETSGWSTNAHGGKTWRSPLSPLRQLRGVAGLTGRVGQGWTGWHPDSFFWWLFMLGVSLWVLLSIMLLVQFKTRDAYYVKGTSGADVAETEVTVRLPVFEAGSRLEGMGDDYDERYKFYNISDFKPVEVTRSERKLPLDDEDFQMPEQTPDLSDSIFSLKPMEGSFSGGLHQISVVGPQGVLVTVQRKPNPKEKASPTPELKPGVAFGDLGSPLVSPAEKETHEINSETRQITVKRVPRVEHGSGSEHLLDSPREAAVSLKVMDSDLPAAAVGRGDNSADDSRQIKRPGRSVAPDSREKLQPAAASGAVKLTALEDASLQAGKPESRPQPLDLDLSGAAESAESGAAGQSQAAEGNVSIFNTTADFAWARRLGQERPMPDHKVIKAADSCFIYGRLQRWSRRSDISDRIKMIPTPEAAAYRPSEFRQGCPAATQPLRLVPEFSNYIFKHYAATRAGSALRYAHMGTLAPMPYGGLVSAFQASHFTEGAEDQRIFLSFSKDDDIGQTWTEPIRLPVHARGAQWGPVLHVHPKTGNVWLFYTESSDKTCLRPGTAKFPPRFAPGGDVMVTKTRDGKTWAAPHRIYSMAAEGGAPKVIANSVHVSRNGTWMLPFWRESHYFNEQTPCHTDTPASHGVLISRDDGRTWEPKGTIEMEGSHVYEGSIAEIGDGSAVMAFRTQLGAAAMSRSTDDGETWGDPYLIAADNPDSKPNLVNVWPNGEVLMAYNDHTKENIACKNCRSKLAISRLVNATASWDHVAQFGPSPSDYLKVHYPTLVQHGCRLFAIYSSMYACCSPFGARQCECAPEGAEVGLLMVSFKIWEDGKTPEEQMANHTLRGKTRAPASVRPWENHWWNDFQDASIFDSLVQTKHMENLRATRDTDSFPDGLSNEPPVASAKGFASQPWAGSRGPRKVQFGLHSLDDVVAGLRAKEARAKEAAANSTHPDGQAMDR